MVLQEKFFLIQISFTMKYPLSLILLFVTTFLLSQNQTEIESIEKKLKGLTTNQEIIDNYEKVIKYYLNEDQEKAKRYIEDLRKLNQKDDCIECEMTAWRYHGILYDRKGNIPSAIEAFEAEIQLARKINDQKHYTSGIMWKVQLMILDEHQLEAAENELSEFVTVVEKNNWEINMGTVYGMYAMIHFIKGNLYLTKDYYLKAEKFLDQNEKFDSPNFRLTIYTNNAQVYKELNDIDKAYEYVNKSLELAKETDDAFSLNTTLLFASEMDFHKKEYKKALETALKCYEYFEVIDDSYYLYLNSLLLARIYNGLKDYAKAEKYILIAEDNINERGAFIELANTLAVKGEILVNLDKLPQAEETIKQAHQLLETINDSSTSIDILNAEILYYKKLGNYDKVFKIYQKRDSLQQIVHDNANQNVVNELETQYQTAKKEQQIELLSAENELGKQRRKSQFTIFAAILGLVCIAGLALAFAYRNKIKTAEKIKELNAMKSRFFANISHEFRTPLTLIKSPLQTLQSELNDEKQQKQLSLIDKNSNRMLELVDQLLELSKIDSGKLKLILKEGNISSFLNSIAEPFEFRAKDKGQEFSCQIENQSENHFFDKDVIEKIVSNLLSNAVKYTPKGEKIEFKSKVKNENLHLKISNSGTNLKKQDLPKLFERFYQKSDQQQGFGIGLALIKELIDLYKGKIETSIENEVLSFQVSIPLKPNETENLVITKEEPQTIISQSPEANQDEELPVLLIADDNAEIRSVLKDLFAENYKIIEAKNGKEALKEAQKEIPDCIISDVMMPEMDGFEFTKNLKENELTSFIPVILLTAKSSEEAHLKGLKTEADAFLTKPFHNEILKEKVSRLIAERKKLQERYSRELILKPVDIVINSVDEKFLEKLGEVMKGQLTNTGFSTDEFASEVGMSRMQLHRKLKTLLNVSATEFIRNERLKAAAELMKKGNKNVSEIAYNVGFNDVSYFSKSFKDLYHVTPSEFIHSCEKENPDTENL